MRSRKLVFVPKAFAQFGGSRGLVRLRNMPRQPILLNSPLHLTSHLRVPRQMPIANKGCITGG